MKREIVRPKNARPLRWLHLLATGLGKQALPQSQLAKASSNLLNHRDVLVAHREHPFARLDNNRVENAIRPSAIGMTYWLFIGHLGAGKRSAIVYSLVVSRPRHGKDPLTYLRDVLRRLLAMSNQDDLRSDTSDPSGAAVIIALRTMSNVALVALTLTTPSDRCDVRDRAVEVLASAGSPSAARGGASAAALIRSTISEMFSSGCQPRPRVKNSRRCCPSSGSPLCVEASRLLTTCVTILTPQFIIKDAPGGTRPDTYGVPGVGVAQCPKAG